MKRAKKEYQRDLNEIERYAWGLIYAMTEVGADPDSLRRRPKSGKKGVSVKWWEAEWNGLRNALEARGLNCDPELDE